ncbi:MAG: response regulator transcription factor [Solirubrobacterales bacterium]|nr:response regulator transcription factor [Solirubrobacterales bacterium]
MNVLVVEDEPRIASFVKRGLEAEGFGVTLADDGRTGLELARDGAYDIVILDLILPRLSGEQVLERLREEQPDLPVIVLSAKDAISDRVTTIEAGADDYLTKPFSFSELLARINARLRSARRPTPAVVSAAGVIVDPRRSTATVQDRTVKLTARELALLQMFVRRPNEVLPTALLLDRVWGPDEEDSDVVDAYVRYLRRKLGAHLIEAVAPGGYRLLVPDATPSGPTG